MSVFGYPDPPTTAPRALRRLSHSPAVPTTYLSRNVELEAMEAEAAAAVRQGYDEGYAEGLARAAAVAAGCRHEESQRVAGALSALSDGRGRSRGERAPTCGRRSRRPPPSWPSRSSRRSWAGSWRWRPTPGRDAIARVLALDEGMQPATVRLNPVDVEAFEALDLGRVVNVVGRPCRRAGWGRGRGREGRPRRAAGIRLGTGAAGPPRSREPEASDDRAA